MKKSLLIILLFSLQGACSSQPGVIGESVTLLSYADLATEITVGYEDLAGGEPRVPSDDEPADTP